MVLRIGSAVLTWVAVMQGGSALAEPCPTLRAPGLKSQERTQVLVLASPHIGQQIPADAKWEGLAGLIEALARYRADLIAVEAMPGELLENYERLSPTYDGVLSAFAGETLAVGKAGRQAAKLNRRDASEQADTLLASWVGASADSIPPASRKRAALLLAAAYELPSAALQWSYLDRDQRIADESLPSEVADGLNRVTTSRNEIGSIAISLAARLNLQRLEAADDQSDALFQLRYGEPLMKELSQSPELAKLQDSLLLKELPQRVGKHAAEGDFLGLYRWMNGPGYGAADVDAQWHIFHRTRLASGLDRRRAALWEARNLRIAANIRAAAADFGSRRLLVLFGASHKPFLDAYFQTMMDVEVVDAESILGR